MKDAGQQETKKMSGRFQSSCRGKWKRVKRRILDQGEITYAKKKKDGRAKISRTKTSKKVVLRTAADLKNRRGGTSILPRDSGDERGGLSNFCWSRPSW